MVSLTIAAPIASLVFGFLVLAFPKFLRVFVGIYFLLIGILGLL